MGTGRTLVFVLATCHLGPHCFDSLFCFGGLDINEVWADDRVVDVKTRSYDLGHILNIEHRIDATDDSITPHTERE